MAWNVRIYRIGPIAYMPDIGLSFDTININDQKWQRLFWKFWWATASKDGAL